MGSDMTLQQPGPGEGFAAELALAALVVGPQVHGVGRHGDVGLVAMGTFPCFLVLQRSKQKRGVLSYSNVRRQLRTAKMLLANVNKNG